MAPRTDRGALVSSRAEALSRSLDLLAEVVAPALTRADVDQALADARVRVIIEPGDLADATTQAAAYVLCGLLARSGISVEADFADVGLGIELPRLEGRWFGPAIARALPLMFPGSDLLRPAEKADFVLAFGRAPVPDAVQPVVRLSAEALVARGGATLSPTSWRPANALVALAAAGLGASEIHKAILRRASPQHLDMLEPRVASFEVPFTLPERIGLGNVDVISAGAITQNLLLVLAALPEVEGELQIFDRDVVALSNANRCPFVFIDRLEGHKVARIAEALPRRLAVIPVPRHLDADTSARIAPGARILVGADDIGARHLAQRLKPSWLGIGATSHFLALVSDHRPGLACAGCLHPHLGEDLEVIPTVSVVSFWAGYLLALRLLAHSVGPGYPATRQVTNFWPLRPDALFEHPLAFNANCPIGHREYRELEPMPLGLVGGRS
jgi:hypothetical protein